MGKFVFFLSMPHSLFSFSVVAMHNTPLRYLSLKTAKAKEKGRKRERKKKKNKPNQTLKIKDGGKKLLESSNREHISQALSGSNHNCTWLPRSTSLILEPNLLTQTWCSFPVYYCNLLLSEMLTHETQLMEYILYVKAANPHTISAAAVCVSPTTSVSQDIKQGIWYSRFLILAPNTDDLYDTGHNALN